MNGDGSNTDEKDLHGQVRFWMVRRMVGKVSASKKVKNDGPATEKQIAYLENLGVEIQPGLTKARASELIDEATAEGA